MSQNSEFIYGKIGRIKFAWRQSVSIKINFETDISKGFGNISIAVTSPKLNDEKRYRIWEINCIYPTKGILTLILIYKVTRIYSSKEIRLFFNATIFGKDLQLIKIF